MKIHKILLTMGVAMALGTVSCDKTQSYSELLHDQELACNWYLAQQEVELELPADGNFKTGPDAPYYRLDEEGQVYMQVVTLDTSQMAESGATVYFRFKRMDLKSLYEGGSPSWQGNTDNLDTTTATSFVYGNSVLPSSQLYGEGIQWPLKYVGYNSEVNIVLKSTEGFKNDQTYCIPYLLNIRYFKAEF